MGEERGEAGGDGRFAGRGGAAEGEDDGAGGRYCGVRVGKRWGGGLGHGDWGGIGRIVQEKGGG